VKKLTIAVLLTGAFVAACGGGGSGPTAATAQPSQFLNKVVNYVTDVNKATAITVSAVVGLSQQQEQMDLGFVANVVQNANPHFTRLLFTAAGRRAGG